MAKSYDPRVKFLLALTLSTVGVISDNLWISAGNFILACLYAVWFGVDLLQVVKKTRRLLYFFGALILMQSLFTKGGEAFIRIGGFTLLTDYGLELGVNYLFRVLIIMISGAIISTSSMRESIQGIQQLGLPYEIGFMTALGTRFLPLLMEEVGNTYTSMELRGINMKRLKLGQRIEIIGRLFVPIIYSTLVRAKELSESAQSRGFIVGSPRTSRIHLKFQLHDYVMSLIVLVVSSVLMVAMFTYMA